MSSQRLAPIRLKHVGENLHLSPTNRMSVSLPADLAPYRAQRIVQEPKFAAFLDFVGKSALAKTDARDSSEYVIQLVAQVNFGAVLSKRYFATAALMGAEGDALFVEVTETQILEMNLKKANAFKNFKSATENRFYEMNLYLRATNDHPRADIAIDL